MLGGSNDVPLSERKTEVLSLLSLLSLLLLLLLLDLLNLLSGFLGSFFSVRLGHGENSRFLMVLLFFLRLLKTCGRRDTSRFFGRSASPTWTRGRCSVESSISLLL